MIEIKIGKTESGKLYCQSPYHPDFPKAARLLGGKWDTKKWVFDSRDEERVRDLCREIYGTDGNTPVGDLVTLRVTVPKKGGFEARGAGIYIAGRSVAYAFHRDSGARLGDGVVFLEGEARSGGSRINWKTLINGPAVFEIRDVPRAMAEQEVATPSDAEMAEYPYPDRIEIVGEEPRAENVVPLRSA